MYQVEERAIESLVPYVNNSRTHSAAQVAQIAASLAHFGWTNPILVDGSNGIIAGHGRLMAARNLHEAGTPIRNWDNGANVPVIELSHLTDAERRAYVIADNKLAENAGWDDELLAVELAAIGELGFDLSLTGFESDEITALLADGVANVSSADDEDVPELPHEATTVLGDVWILGDHRLMCGDATNPANVEELVNGQTVDMIFTDPPYGIGMDKKRHMGKSKIKGVVMNDHDNQAAIDAFNLLQTTYTCPMFFWGANHYSNALPPSPCWVVWDKQGGKRVDFADVELCYTNLTGGARMFTHIWDGFRRDSEKGETRVHPTQKPVQLIMDIWAFFEKHLNGFTVLDLFGGSGSTLIACEKTKRTGLIMELEPRYCDAIIQRWQMFTGMDARLDGTNQSFRELKKHEG